MIFRRVLSVPPLPPPISLLVDFIATNRFFTIISRRMRFREKSVSTKVVGNKIFYKIHPWKSSLGLFFSPNIHNSDIFVFLSCLFVLPWHSQQISLHSTIYGDWNHLFQARQLKYNLQGIMCYYENNNDTGIQLCNMSSSVGIVQ